MHIASIQLMPLLANADAIQGDLEPHDSAAQRQYVGVVVLSTQPRHGVICAQRSSNHWKTIRSNRNPYARATNHNSFVYSLGCNRFSHCVSEIGIVDGRIVIRSEIEPIDLADRLFELFLEIKAGVV